MDQPSVTITGPRRAAAALAALLAGALPGAARAAVCSNPGRDGVGTISGIVNAYYPGVSAPAGATTLTVGAVDTSGGGAATALAPGDLVLVIQMQDADIDYSNTAAYGGSAPGTGYTALNSAGRYEYAVVASVAGGSVGLTTPLQNGYRSAAATASAGKRTFQVIRVPQYTSASFASGTVYAAPPWNGATGGVVAIDVAGQLSWGNATVEVSGRGFRGGAGRSMGGIGSSTGYAATDYRTLAQATVNGSKGEGVAGTPRFVWIPTAGTPANYLTNNAGTVYDYTVEGYPSGSNARGAPGNAGGGGSDGNPVNNEENTGGGGGGAYSVGGMGGYGWTFNTPPGSKTGGFGGYSIPMGPGLLTLGGGGGAGSMNNGTGNPGGGPATSGAAGGGVVIIRAGTITGTGTINANGTNANNTVLNDASGGGGGGGAVLVFASGGDGSVGSLTVNAKGGNGGTNSPGFNMNPHGPGGGGSGGFVGLTSAAGVLIDVGAGLNGTTNTSATTTAEYGATASAGGWRLYGFNASDMPGATTSPLCLPQLTVTKTTPRPDVTAGGAGAYVLTVRNASGYGTATGVTLSDALPGAPTAFTFASTDAVTLTGGATRTATAEPAAPTSSPSWGTFSVPGGGAVSVRFSVAIPAGAPLATYQNPGAVTYADPTRTGASPATITPGDSYGSGGGTVPGSNYVATSSMQEDVTVWAPAALTKSFNPASVTVGQSTVLSIAIANPNSAALTAVALADTYPTHLVNTAAPAAAFTGTGCSGAVTAAAGGGSVSLSSGTIPANATCTLRVNVTATATGSLGNVIPAGALTAGHNVTNTAAASATLSPAAAQPPAASTAFLPAAIQTGAATTLQITLFNPGNTDLTAVAFTDTLTNIAVASAPAVVSNCGGSVTAAAGSGSVRLTGGALAAGATCTVTVQVTSNTVSPAQGHPNLVTGVTSLQSGAGADSNTAYLVVAGTPTIAKAFSPTLIGPGEISTLTFTLTNPGNVPLTGASFTDAMGNLRVATSGPAGGTCAGAAANSLSAGTTTVAIGGLTLAAGGASCTVTVPVTGTAGGPQVNIANGVVSNETPTPGPQSGAATLNVRFAPRAAKSFAGEVEAASPTSYSTLTISISNPNAGTALTGVGFTDALTNMVVYGTPAATNTCGGTFAPAGGASVLTLTGGGLAAGASCAVTVRIRSSTPSPAGGHPNTVAATAAETGAGPSATAYLNVLSPPTISAVFAPAAVATGATSTLIFTLTNPNGVALSGVTFSDTFPANLTTTNLAQNFVGTGRGTCNGPIPAAAAAGTYAPSVAFAAINIPASSSCTIYVDVRSAIAGTYTTSTSTVTSFQTPTAGPGSNTATLSVGGMSVAKAFAPATVVVSGSSILTFTLGNATGGAQTPVAFTDAFPAGMQVANPLTVTNGCGGSLRDQADTRPLAAGDTGLRYVGGNVTGASCTVSVAVTPTAAGTYSNTATNFTFGASSTAGPNSTPAILVAVGHPTIALAFAPASLDLYATSVMTFTLTNGNGTTLSSARFTDTLTGFTVAAPATLGGSCAGVTSTPVLAAGAAALDLTVASLLPGSCTITVPVTRSASTPGTFSNSTGGVTTTQTAAAGPVSNTAAITFNRLPLHADKATTAGIVTPGTAVTYVITYSNPNATMPFGSVVITDTTPQFTSFVSAACGALPAGVTSCAVSAPAVGAAGTVTWTLGGTLSAGASGTVTMTVVVN